MLSACCWPFASISRDYSESQWTASSNASSSLRSHDFSCNELCPDVPLTCISSLLKNIYHSCQCMPWSSSLYHPLHWWQLSLGSGFGYSILLLIYPIQVSVKSRSTTDMVYRYRYHNHKYGRVCTSPHITSAWWLRSLNADLASLQRSKQHIIPLRL